MRAPVLHSSHWSRIFHDTHTSPHRHRPLPPTPLLSFSHPSIRPFLLPYALPSERSLFSSLISSLSSLSNPLLSYHFILP